MVTSQTLTGRDSSRMTTGGQMYRRGSFCQAKIPGFTSLFQEVGFANWLGPNSVGGSHKLANMT